MLYRNFLHTHPGTERLIKENKFATHTGHDHFVIDAEDYQKIFKFLYNNPEVTKEITDDTSIIVKDFKRVRPNNRILNGS